MADETAAERLTRALAKAAEGHAKALRTAERSRLSAFEADVLLFRMGIRTGAATTPGAADDATAAVSRLALLGRLRSEAARQVRLARAGSPRYDLNRHIALHRLIEGFAAPEPSKRPRRPTRRLERPHADRAGSSAR